MQRPYPPPSLFTEESEKFSVRVMPAPDVLSWVKQAIIEDSGNIHNHDHEHLADADIEFMWASRGFEKQGRGVIGQAEQVMFRVGGWQKNRAEQQMIDWFGRIPEFIITLDAAYCESCGDADFCALVEHELYHIAQAVDGFGLPKFKEDGTPKLKIRGHDVEEFVGVVRRYGANQQVGEMVKAANSAPEVSMASISSACGTCLLKLA